MQLFSRFQTANLCARSTSEIRAASRCNCGSAKRWEQIRLAELGNVKSALGVLLRENPQVAWQLDDLLVVAKSPELAVDHSVVD